MRQRFYWDEANQCDLFVRRELPLHSNTNAKRHIRLVVVFFCSSHKAFSPRRIKGDVVCTGTANNFALFDQSTGIFFQMFLVGALRSKKCPTSSVKFFSKATDLTRF